MRNSSGVRGRLRSRGRRTSARRVRSRPRAYGGGTRAPLPPSPPALARLPDVARDGTCLFRSVLYLLTNDEAVRHDADVTSFRRRVVDAIPETDAVLAQVNHDGDAAHRYRSVAEYKRYMRSHPHAWGGGAELLSICRLFEVRIHVYDAVHARWTAHIRDAVDRPPHRERCLYLYYENQNHYRPMV